MTSGVPVIRGGNMGDGPWVGGEFAFVTKEKWEADLARNSASPGDLVFTQRGTLGQVAIVPNHDPVTYVVSQSQMRLRVDPNKADPRYVYYACRSASFRQQIADREIATGVPHINLSILGDLVVPLPAMIEQKAIAEVLGAFDDKIAANGKLAATIDDLLAAKFDRLTAKSTFDPLTTIAEVNMASTKPCPGRSLRYLDIASVGVGTYELPEEIRWENAPDRARRVLRPGDTVWSTVRPNRRSHALVLDDQANLIASTGLAVLTPKDNLMAFVYQATRTSTFTAYLESATEGSAYPAVRPDRFLDAPVPRVEDSERMRFESEAAPLRHCVHSAAVETRLLEGTRDALLPELMSGRLRVRDAERVVKSVV
ncbi:MAG: restriction endonuclease subunit S [Actinomycetales bacterium]|nr:restriction endonuclease subunit S [Actinomycetales bacterium]